MDEEKIHESKKEDKGNSSNDNDKKAEELEEHVKDKADKF